MRPDGTWDLRAIPSPSPAPGLATAPWMTLPGPQRGMCHFVARFVDTYLDPDPPDFPIQIPDRAALIALIVDIMAAALELPR